jgi:predicted metalloprotease with PDZ domain
MHYTIEAFDLNAHLFRITLTLPASDQPTDLKLPVWIPGSYLIREFSRHLVAIRARSSGGKPVAVLQTAKNAWRVAAASKAREVIYEVYALDQSVRTAWLDADRGFFNGTSVFLYSDSTRLQPCSVHIKPPKDARCKSWQLATTLMPKRVSASGFGEYSAASYDELIDKPVTMGRLQRASFKAHGTPHEIVVTGAEPFDIKLLASHAKKICEQQIAMFEPKSKKAPFKRYLFMLHASGDGYGGLEHGDSTALICKRADLPQAGADKAPLGDGYVTLLGLFSHEYFHSWNVKRIKPRAFEPYDLEQENYTRLLWLFEGFTSYYDDLLLLRAGLIDEARYLKLLARSVSHVLTSQGAKVESVANASFNAWIKYYRADENTPNSTVSYYIKGSTIALAIDLMLRGQTQRSLDDVMRTLWQRWLRREPGVQEDEMPALIEHVAGRRVKGLKELFASAVHGTEPPALHTLLAAAGITLNPIIEPSPALGGRVDAGEAGVLVAHAITGGALQAAGLAKGDLIVAVSGEQVNRQRWEAVKALLKPGHALALHYFRDGLLRNTKLTVATPGVKDWQMQRGAKPKNAPVQLRTWPLT